MQNSQKKSPNFLHQFGFTGRAVLIVSTKGRPLQSVASGVSHGVHWAVYKIGAGQAHGEVWVDDGLVKIVKVFPEGVKPVWEASVGKDGRRPPDGWQEAVEAAIGMAMCPGINCKGHFPIEKPIKQNDTEFYSKSKTFTQTSAIVKPVVQELAKNEGFLGEAKRVGEPQKSAKIKAVEIFSAKEREKKVKSFKKDKSFKKKVRKVTIKKVTLRKRGRPKKVER